MFAGRDADRDQDLAEHDDDEQAVSLGEVDRVDAPRRVVVLVALTVDEHGATGADEHAGHPQGDPPAAVHESAHSDEDRTHTGERRVPEEGRAGEVVAPQPDALERQHPDRARQQRETELFTACAVGPGNGDREEETGKDRRHEGQAGRGVAIEVDRRAQPAELRPELPHDPCDEGGLGDPGPADVAGDQHRQLADGEHEDEVEEQLEVGGVPAGLLLEFELQLSVGGIGHWGIVGNRPVGRSGRSKPKRAPPEGGTR